MKTPDLATLLVVAPAGTLNLTASNGPGPKLAELLSDLATQILAATYDITKESVGDLLDQAGYALDQIGGALKRIYGMTDPAEAGKLLGNISL